MNRLERLTSILIQLQSRRVNKASEIAERFGMSIRTVYRDIKALEEAGVPIGVDAGKGYFIVPGYHVPPVMFTSSEAAALLTGEKMLNSFGDVSIKNEISSALIKIRAVLKEKEKEKLEELESSIHIYSRTNTFEKESKWITKIQEVIIENTEVKITYFSTYSDSETVRVVCPIGLTYYSDSWHLIAFCRLRNDYRDFRVDRIKDLSVTDKKFNKAEFSSLQDYVDKLYSSENLKKAVVRIQKQTAKYLQRQKYLYGLVKEVEKGQYVEMTFLTHSYDYFAKWLLLFATCVEIVTPPQLLDIAIEQANTAQLHFEKQLHKVAVTTA
jgi:predicted DNA-binding transcriptional regulator YafY